MINNKKLEWLLLSLVLLLALALRAYNFTELSYFHDELSALTRTKFDSLSELFSKGILVDGHPPLIQVFLYLWTGIFGYGETVVKLPFLLVSMASLFMLYKMSKILSKSWIIALGALLFFATNQLHISYSTIARMYITGFLFSVSLVYFWWKWLQENQKRDFILMIVVSILGAYNHHFNLLFAILVWVSGLFYIDTNQKKPYLTSLGIVFLAYLPSIYISFFQLFETKGLNWMKAPNVKFIFNFILYIFHFRISLALILLAGIALSFLSKTRIRGIIILGLGWFIACLTIAYLYSIHIAPVIQYHLLLFALPFPILAALTGWKQILKGRTFEFFIGLIAIVNLFTLIKERKHFDYFAKQPYKIIAEEVAKLGDSRTLIVSNLTMQYFDFYLKDRYTTVDTLSLENLNSKSFLEIKTKYDYIVTSGISEAMESYFTPYFGSIQPSIQGFGYEIDILKKQTNPVQIKKSISKLDFLSQVKHWTYDLEKIKVEANNYLKNENDEWGPNYERKLDHSLRSELLCFEADYTGDEKIGEQFLVINFHDKNGNEVNNNIYPFEIEQSNHGKKTIRAIFDLDDLEKDAYSIKAFHWKRSKTSMVLHEFRMFTMNKIKPITFVSDSLVSSRSFNQKEQENWSNLPYNKVLLENQSGQQYYEFDNTQAWFATYDFSYDYKHTYAFEFEFMADKLNPLSSIILSAKQGDETVYWTEQKLNTFARSDNTSWTKATIAIPYSVLKKHEDLPLDISFSGYKAAGPKLKIKNPIIRSYKPNLAVYGSINEILK